MKYYQFYCSVPTVHGGAETSEICGSVNELVREDEQKEVKGRRRNKRLQAGSTDAVFCAVLNDESYGENRSKVTLSEAAT